MTVNEAIKTTLEDDRCWLHICVALAIPLFYVGSIYALDGREEHRNHPTTIRKRFLASTLSTALVLAVTWSLFAEVGSLFYRGNWAYSLRI